MAYLDYPGLQRYHGKVQEEIDELKDDLSNLGLEVVDGKLCIILEGDEENE